MSRRRSVRRLRRVQVQFWKHGDPTGYAGYTTNLSMTGMFIATNSPVAPGSRLRVEVIDRDRGFMVEGVVAHARRIRGDLARLSQSGMGVRFLSVEELVRELIPTAYGKTELIEPVDFGERIEIELDEPIAPIAPIAPIEAVEAPALPEPDPPLPPPPPAPPRAVPPPVGTSSQVSVRFESPEEFLQVYHRDIVQGGLFVSTREPARLMATVSVELLPPLAGAGPVSFRARVVQCFPPHGAAGDAPNLLSGMGLELADLPQILARLQPIVERLQ